MATSRSILRDRRPRLLAVLTAAAAAALLIGWTAAAAPDEERAASWWAADAGAPGAASGPATGPSSGAAVRSSALEHDPVDAESAEVAVLRVVQGTVELVREGTSSVAAGGETVGPGDVLVTGATGVAELVYPDGSLTRIGSGSRLQVEVLATAPARVRVSLDVGSTWHRVQDLTRSRGSFEVETPTGVAAVRGTAFLVTCEGAACSVAVVEGRVDVGVRRPGAAVLLPGDSVRLLLEGLGSVEPWEGGDLADEIAENLGRDEDAGLPPAVPSEPGATAQRGPDRDEGTEGSDRTQHAAASVAASGPGEPSRAGDAGRREEPGRSGDARPEEAPGRPEDPGQGHAGPPDAPGRPEGAVRPEVPGPSAGVDRPEVPGTPRVPATSPPGRGDTPAGPPETVPPGRAETPPPGRAETAPGPPETLPPERPETHEPSGGEGRQGGTPAGPGPR